MQGKRLNSVNTSCVISVIIPNYNGARLISLCLDSLRSQSFRDFETIVVDNNSSDNSCALLEKEYPEVQVIRMDHNSGFSAAVNRGIEKARGDYIALFNNDAAAEPQWLETLLEAMKNAKEKVGICASRILFYFRRDVIDTTGVIMYDDGIICNRGNMEQDTGRYDREEFVFGACAAAALYRREMLEEIKVEGQVFDEDFFAYYEDADVNLRSQLLGYKCLYVPGALVYHVGSATSRRLKVDNGQHQVAREIVMEEADELYPKNCMIYYYASNFWNILIKDMPADYFWKKLWKVLLFETMAAFSALINRRLLIFLKGHWRILKLIPAMARKRRHIQGTRKVDNDCIYSLLISRTARDYTKMAARTFVKRLGALADRCGCRRSGKRP